ncbi:DUF3280 domain-containing protein [Labrys wisconsinensis]|uniref:DUF2380 domain-containing protein n=1 Tax=Labrys wisconsinensis TaxID=425677 RepID=A0ABU0IYJ2_9HYPH|nr:DUF3280 domain-containing protein [Labrys wisconsinensis]MDQ0467078.1 hypothetical protein [Labrys wisconsinensis]
MERNACLALISTILAVISPAVAGTGAIAAPLKAAVFGFELVDTSEEGQLTGERPDQTRRVALASTELRRLLDASGQIAEVDLAPQAAAIRKGSPLYRCNGCAADIARDLGAEVSIIGLVQKTSNLILSFRVEVTDVRSGRMLRGGQVDIRGNNDEMWLRGVRFLVKDRLTDPPLAAPAP